MPAIGSPVGGSEFSGYHSSCNVVDGPKNEKSAFEQLKQRFGENKVSVVNPSAVQTSALGEEVDVRSRYQLVIKQQRTSWSNSFLVFSTEHGVERYLFAFHHTWAKGRHEYRFNTNNWKSPATPIKIERRMWRDVSSLDGNDNVYYYASLFNLHTSCTFPQI